MRSRQFHHAGGGTMHSQPVPGCDGLILHVNLRHPRLCVIIQHNPDQTFFFSGLIKIRIGKLLFSGAAVIQTHAELAMIHTRAFSG